MTNERSIVTADALILLGQKKDHECDLDYSFVCSFIHLFTKRAKSGRYTYVSEWSINDIERKPTLKYTVRRFRLIQIVSERGPRHEMSCGVWRAKVL